MCQRLTFLLVAVLVLGGFGLGPAGAYDRSLCGWWPLDDGSGTTAADASGLAVKGTLFGNPVWSKTGVHGGCLTFDGVDDYVFIDGKFKYGNYTVAIWFRDDSAGQRDIVSCCAPGPSHGILLEIGTDGRMRFLHRFPLGTSGGTSIYSTASYADGKWHHVAATKSATTITLYMDGTQAATAADSSVFGASDAFGICLGVLANGQTPVARPLVGAMDDLQIYYRALSAGEIPGTMLGVVDKSRATVVSPSAGATDVPRDATLNWDAGENPSVHDIYLGTTLADVNAASRTAAKGVLVSKGQADTAFTPASMFAYGQTYYWRVDEVNQSADATLFKGTVWSFTVEPYSYPITAKIATTASSAQAGMGPEKTVDGSGLTGDVHGNDTATMWLSTGTSPNWIQYQFDKVYKLDRLLVWNVNEPLESLVGFGAKDVKVEYSTEGATWTALANVPQFSQAPGTAGYAANTTVNFGAVMAKYVKLTINSNWGACSPVVGLSEMRFYYAPVQARVPQPAAGATGVDPRSLLTWRSGREAAKHQVYLSTDANAVRNGTAPVTTMLMPSFDTSGTFLLGQTYYWKVNEVNDAMKPSTWEGDVWSFSTAALLVVDNMEIYNVTTKPIYETWVDGFGTTTNGSQVGYTDPKTTGTYGDVTTFHGGKQSMPFQYGLIAGKPSEATCTFDGPQDWTLFGIKGLLLWFYGNSTNTVTTMYVKINGVRVAYDGDPGALLAKGWHLWYIDLSTLTGVNLKKVTDLTIGFEGGKGIVLFDDIALTASSRQLVTPVAPAATNLVAHYLFDGNVKDATGNHSGTAFGAPTYPTGKVGQAIKFDGLHDYVDSPGTYTLVSYTVALWFRVDSGTGSRDLVSMYDDKGASGVLLEVQDPATVRFLHRAPLGVASANESISSTSTYGDGTWYHVAAVKSATTASLYINGELVASVANSAVFDKALTHLTVGVLRVDSLSRYLPGAVDDLYLYARALSQAEVASLAGRTQPFDRP